VTEAGASEPREQAFAARSPGFIGGVYLASQTVDRLAAFALFVLLAGLYGISHSADTYFLAAAAPLAIGGALGEPLARAFQTSLVSHPADEGGRCLAAAGLALTAAVVVGMTAVYLAVALPLVVALHQGPVWVWLLLSTTGVALGLITYSSSVLVWLEDYVWSALRFPLVSISSLVLVGSIASATRSLVAVAAAVALAYALTAALLYVRIARSLGASWGIRFGRADAVRAVGAVRHRVAAPMLGGLLGGQVIVLVERYLAAGLAVGSVAVLSYARGIAGTPMIVAQSLGAGRYPSVVRAQAVDALDYVRSSFVRGLRVTLLIAGAFAVVFVFFARDIVAVLLEHGGLEAGAARSIAHVLALLSLWTVSGSLGFYLVFIFYGVDYFKGILYFEAAVFGAYVVLAPVLRGLDGVDGLAIALSVAHVFGSTIALGIVARRLDVQPLELVRRLLPILWRLAALAGEAFALRVALDGAPRLLRLVVAALVVGTTALVFVATLDDARGVRGRMSRAVAAIRRG